MKIGIFGRTFSKTCAPFVQALLNELNKAQVTILIFEDFQEFLIKNDFHNVSPSTFSTKEDLKEVEIMLSIGGDGTLLETVTYVAEMSTPILGINAGRLGFLATIPIEKVTDAIHQIIAGSYGYDDRILVKASTTDNLFGELNFGLNEFVIHKRDTSSMIVVHTYVDDKFLNSYWVDGMIVSTPTGSTGYSLSCGGPLVLPHTNNFVIAPVNPHNLNVRPMIVPDTSTISFKVEGRANKVLVSLDSRSKSAKMDTEISITKANFHARLIALPSDNFFNTLRHKLNWGLDTRN